MSTEDEGQPVGLGELRFATMGIAAAVMNREAAKDAAREQSRASDAAVAEQRRQFDLIREDQAPWQATGRSALNQLARLFGLDTGEGGAPSAPDMSGFYESPDYAYSRDQSMRQIERSAAARGGLASGGTLAALQRNASGLASQNYGNYVNRLAGLAGVGQTANSELANAGLITGQNVGNYLIHGGDARASGILGAQAAINQSMNNTLGIFGGFMGYGRRNQGPGGYGGP